MGSGTLPLLVVLAFKKNQYIAHQIRIYPEATRRPFPFHSKHFGCNGDIAFSRFTFNGNIYPISATKTRIDENVFIFTYDIRYTYTYLYCIILHTGRLQAMQKVLACFHLFSPYNSYSVFGPFVTHTHTQTQSLKRKDFALRQTFCCPRKLCSISQYCNRSNGKLNFAWYFTVFSFSFLRSRLPHHASKQWQCYFTSASLLYAVCSLLSLVLLWPTQHHIIEQYHRPSHIQMRIRLRSML